MKYDKHSNGRLFQLTKCSSFFLRSSLAALCAVIAAAVDPYFTINEAPQYANENIFNNGNLNSQHK